VSWGALIVVREEPTPPCDGCPSAISNPNPVEIVRRDGSRAVLLHYDTLNNPRPGRTGKAMQMYSLDDGVTWTLAHAIAYPPRPNEGAMPGPSVGLQAGSGRILFSAHVAASYWRPPTHWHGARDDVAFLYWSDDDGASWRSSADVAGLNECSIAFLVDASDGRVLANCRTRTGSPRAQLVFSADGQPGAVRPVPDLVDPGCQGSLIQHTATRRNGTAVARHYLSHVPHASERFGMVVRTSRTQGASWSGGVCVHDGPAAYSQLVHLGGEGGEGEGGGGEGGGGEGGGGEGGGSTEGGGGRLGLLFEAGRPASWWRSWWEPPSPYETISFVRLQPDTLRACAPPPATPAYVYATAAFVLACLAACLLRSVRRRCLSRWRRGAPLLLATKRAGGLSESAVHAERMSYEDGECTSSASEMVGEMALHRESAASEGGVELDAKSARGSSGR
jgi:hypothetical protein